MSNLTTDREQVVGLARRVVDAARRQGQDAPAKDVEDALEILRRGRVTAAVVGEFKRGKSTLINALLDEPKLLPVDNKMATSVVTTLSYASTERISVLIESPGGIEPETIEITRQDIADYATETGNPANARRARLVMAELPNERLRNGLVIADTPGVGGVVREHAAVTFGFLLSADVVIFVLDALTPLSTEELEFVRTIAERNRAFLLVVTNKARQGSRLRHRDWQHPAQTHFHTGRRSC